MSAPAISPVGAPADVVRGRSGDRLLRVVTLAGLLVFALTCLAFVFVGRVNADEGWYLYAGRLVYRGDMPYRDFAFTQMPLMPYVYGLVQSLAPGLELGRLTSALFAVGGLVLCLQVARRHAGWPGAATVAVLVAAFPTGAYNLTLAKTYALVAFFLAATLAALTSPGRPERTRPLAVAAAAGAALTRTSAVPLAVLVAAYCLWRPGSERARGRVVVVGGLALAVGLGFVLTDLRSARYDLSTFHQLLWFGAPLGTRLDRIVTHRIPDWVSQYAVYAALTAGAVVAAGASARTRRFLVEQPGYLVVFAGIVGYLALQLPAGQFAPVEYATPVVPVLVVITVVVLVRTLLGSDGRSPVRRWLPAVLAVAVGVAGVLTVVRPAPWEYVEGRDAAGSPAEARRVGDAIRAATRDGDEVLALWAQPAALDSGRNLVPGVTVGPFSYADLTTADARRLHFVNADILARMLRRRRPAAVVLTDVDRLVLGLAGTLSSRPADSRDVLDALDRGYRRTSTGRGYGASGPIRVDVYTRRRS